MRLGPDGKVCRGETPERGSDPEERPCGSPIRRYWPLKENIVFLNHGSFGACPTPILTLQHELRLQMESEPVQTLWRRYEERLEPSRKELAQFVGARERDLVFVTNATTAINAVVGSLTLETGDEILTTNLDYNACRNVLSEAADRNRARLVVARIPFPLTSEEQVMEAVLERVTGKTRLVMLDHITSTTALVLPVGRLCREIESRGIPVLVDGAHAPGMVPLNLQELGASYYTGNLHKWVCAPKGAAFLCTRQDRQKELQPAVISHGSNTPRPGYLAYQDRFDWAGTFDPTAWFCVGEAIRWMAQLVPGGWCEVYQHNRALAVQARRLLAAQLDVDPPCPEEMLGAMATLPLPSLLQGRAKTDKIDSEQLQLYDLYGVEVPFMRFGFPETRCFRLSAHIYNHAGEYAYLGKVLRKLL